MPEFSPTTAATEGASSAPDSSPEANGAVALADGQTALAPEGTPVTTDTTTQPEGTTEPEKQRRNHWAELEAKRDEWKGRAETAEAVRAKVEPFEHALEPMGELWSGFIGAERPDARSAAAFDEQLYTLNPPARDALLGYYAADQEYADWIVHRQLGVTADQARAILSGGAQAQPVAIAPSLSGLDPNTAEQLELLDPALRDQFARFLASERAKPPQLPADIAEKVKAFDQMQAARFQAEHDQPYGEHLLGLFRDKGITPDRPEFGHLFSAVERAFKADPKGGPAYERSLAATRSNQRAIQPNLQRAAKAELDRVFRETLSPMLAPGIAHNEAATAAATAAANPKPPPPTTGVPAPSPGQRGERLSPGEAFKRAYALTQGTS